MSPTRRTGGGRVLVADIGNSEIDLGLFDGERLAGHWRAITRPRTADEAEAMTRALLDGAGVGLRGTATVLCSVVPSATAGFAQALEKLTGRAPLVIGAGSVPQLRVRAKNPAEVGPDRLANAIALRERYGAPAIGVDIGTATTFDVVSRAGEYVGGAIMPGVITSSEELYRRAARLSAVELRPPERTIGRSTEEALRAGILFGAAGAIDALVSRIRHELRAEAPAIATGGLAPLVAPFCQSLNGLDETLTLEGLRLVAFTQPMVRALGSAPRRSRGGRPKSRRR